MTTPPEAFLQECLSSLTPEPGHHARTEPAPPPPPMSSWQQMPAAFLISPGGIDRSARLTGATQSDRRGVLPEGIHTLKMNTAHWRSELFELAVCQEHTYPQN